LPTLHSEQNIDRTTSGLETVI